MYEKVTENSDLICGVGIGLTLGVLMGLTFCIAVFH